MANVFTVAQALIYSFLCVQIVIENPQWLYAYVVIWRVCASGVSSQEALNVHVLPVSPTFLSYCSWTQCQNFRFVLFICSNV